MSSGVFHSVDTDRVLPRLSSIVAKGGPIGADVIFVVGPKALRLADGTSMETLAQRIVAELECCHTELQYSDTTLTVFHSIDKLAQRETYVPQGAKGARRSVHTMHAFAHPGPGYVHISTVLPAVNETEAQLHKQALQELGLAVGQYTQAMAAAALQLAVVYPRAPPGIKQLYPFITASGGELVEPESEGSFESRFGDYFGFPGGHTPARPGLHPPDLMPTVPLVFPGLQGRGALTYTSAITYPIGVKLWDLGLDDGAEENSPIVICGQSLTLHFAPIKL
jgi:hypothetical protein